MKNLISLMKLMQLYSSPVVSPNHDNNIIVLKSELMLVDMVTSVIPIIKGSGLTALPCIYSINATIDSVLANINTLSSGITLVDGPVYETIPNKLLE
jgi:hypothetical protein